VELCYEGLGLADWREVIDAFAKPEPCRPFDMSGTTEERREMIVADVLRLDAHELRDYAGERVRLNPISLAKKLGKYANHGAYVRWIKESLRSPLEVWRHHDPRAPKQYRDHYFAAYVGPSGATSHLVVSLTKGFIINAFRLDSVSNAQDKRFGDLLHVGYDPVYPPLPKAKGAPFPTAPF
jgi:hypothetical protein